MAVYWSWYCSPRRAGERSYGRNNIGNRAYNQENGTFGDYPGWRVMQSQPHNRFGVAGGNRGARRKVHLVRDQIVAKAKYQEEQRMTRWLCGAYTFDGVLQPTADVVCSRCLIVAQHRSVERLSDRTDPRPGGA